MKVWQKWCNNYELRITNLIYIDGQDGKDICFASQKLNHDNLVNHVKIFVITI
jgi:hypothetical protein